MGGAERGYTRYDTHTQRRSTTHHVRSDTPGNNVSYFVIAVFIKDGEAAFLGPNQKFETFETAERYGE